MYFPLIFTGLLMCTQQLFSIFSILTKNGIIFTISLLASLNILEGCTSQSYLLAHWLMLSGLSVYFNSRITKNWCKILEIYSERIYNNYNNIGCFCQPQLTLIHTIVHVSRNSLCFLKGQLFNHSTSAFLKSTGWLSFTRHTLSLSQ